MYIHPDAGQSIDQFAEEAVQVRRALDARITVCVVFNEIHIPINHGVRSEHITREYQRKVQARKPKCGGTGHLGPYGTHDASGRWVFEVPCTGCEDCSGGRG